MKRIIALAAAILLAMTFAWAEEAPGSALTLYEELLRQEATAALELEIVRLERQVAQIQGDSAALAAADAREEEILARQAEIAQAVNDLGLPLVLQLSERIAALDAENARLEEQQAAIRAAMADNDRLRKEFEACREEYVKAHAESASAKVFAADVTVRIFRDETGAVAYLQVDAPWETPGIGSRCTEEAFTGQFIGKTGPLLQIDAVAGATYTSCAVIDAVNSLFTDTSEGAEAE